MTLGQIGGGRSEFVARSWWDARRLAIAACGVAAMFLGACSTLPETGPPAHDIVQGTQGRSGESVDYYLVNVRPDIVSRLEPAAQVRFSPDMVAEKSPPVTIGVGDVLSITIYEAALPSQNTSPVQGGGGPPPSTTGGPSGGVAGGLMETLPNQQVDRFGRITVPYAGTVTAAGRTPYELQLAIEKALRSNVIEPQVIVTVAQSQSPVGTATVTGEVARPGRYGLALTGTRILDAIALAGGTTNATTDMVVNLTRRGVTQRVRLWSIIEDGSQNIYLQPDDLLVLTHHQKSVVLLGATMKDSQIPFTDPKLSLAEALGNANGLSDPVADPAGVFVFRYEPASFVKSLFPNANPQGRVPVVYRVNLMKGSGYFLAQSFQLQDKDVIFVANARTVQLAKLVAILRDVSFIVNARTVVTGP